MGSGHRSSIHSWSVEAPGGLACWRNSNDAAGALELRQTLLDDLVHGLLDSVAFVLDECADIARHGKADEKLARTCR